MKRLRLANTMVVALDRFCKSTHRIEELKVEAIAILHEDNRKLELELFKLIEASQKKDDWPFCKCVLRLLL